MTSSKATKRALITSALAVSYTHLGSIHKGKGGDAKANGKNNNGNNSARQPFSGFGFRHFPHPPYAYGL